MATIIEGDAVVDMPIGYVETVVVGPQWVDLLGGTFSDNVMFRVPPGSRRILLIRSEEPLGGTIATAQQETTSWICDPGVWRYCTDRGLNDARFFLAIDPTDTGDDAASARVKIMRADAK